MKKLVIANWGSAQQGKSSSIKQVFELLRKKYPYDILINGADIKAIVNVNGVKIGIESQGDPNSRIFDSIDDFVKAGCDIIVCACRSWGETRNKVTSLNKSGYDIIWTQNDKSDNIGHHDTLNKLYAEHVIKIIEYRMNGKI